MCICTIPCIYSRNQKKITNTVHRLSVLVLLFACNRSRTVPFYRLSVSFRSVSRRSQVYINVRARSKLIAETKMPFTEYLKRRALVFHSMGLLPAAIAKALSNEGLVATRQGIKKFLDRYEETGTLKRRPGSGRPSRITQAVRAIVEEQMRSDDKTTAVQLAALLNRRGYRFSLMTILRCRQTLGWTFRGSSYCQMIRNANKLKRLEWSR